MQHLLLSLFQEVKRMVLLPAVLAVYETQAEKDHVTALFEAHRRAMYHAARRILSVHEDAEDAVQDAFIIIHDHLWRLEDGVLRRLRLQNEHRPWAARTQERRCALLQLFRLRELPPQRENCLHPAFHPRGNPAGFGAGAHPREGAPSPSTSSR